MKHWLSIKLFMITFLLGGALQFSFAPWAPVAVAQTQSPAATTVTRVIKIPAPEGAKGFGDAIAYDGKTLVVGAPQTEVNSTTQAGAIYAYDLDPQKPESWVLSATLVLSTSNPFTNLGEAVAVEENVIVAGAPRAGGPGTTQLGFVVFFEQTPDNPLWHTTLITYPDPKIGAFSNFGDSIALENGIAFIGAPGADVLTIDGNILGANRGAVFPYARSNGEPGTWRFANRVPIHDGQGQFNDLYGDAVAASNGAFLIGASNGDIEVIFSNEGIAYFYADQSTPAFQIHRGADAENADLFGSAVALDNYGETPLLAIGGYCIDREGRNCMGCVPDSRRENQVRESE